MRPQLHSPRMVLRLRQLLMLLTDCAVAIIVAGCGGDDGTRDLTGEPFTEQNEMDFNRNLDQINQMVEEHDCEGAQSKLDALTNAVNTVPPEIDQQLKDDLIELLGRLGDQIQGECMEEQTTTEEDTTEEPTADTTAVEPTTTTTTTTTTDTAEEPQTPETPDTPDTPDTPSGGTGGQGGTGGGGTGGGGVDPGSGGVAPREAAR